MSNSVLQSTKSSTRGERRAQFVANASLRVRTGVTHVGHLTIFSVQVFRELFIALRLYPVEVLQQAGLLIRRNAAVVLFMVFAWGALVGLTLPNFLGTLGVEAYTSVPLAIALRGVLEAVFAWIFAAKVGCGIVAELGAMGIGEETDAMEVMGVRTLAYLVGTRVLATLIVVPLLWVLAILVQYAGGHVVTVIILQEVSSGMFFELFYLMQNLRDFIFAVVWATAYSILIILVAGYYGYTARSGGPVEVGRNTAQSMIVNMTLISVGMLVLIPFLYGGNANTPMGN